MERKKASDCPQELLDVFHLYVHGDLGCRETRRTAGNMHEPEAMSKRRAQARADRLRTVHERLIDFSIFR